ncbi:unnamed protein product [Cuscuta campestris]|uniref:MATH domain-containing protein n=1 Tax=Cuscuta campestris TaxID=132261 RepID=A0A484NQL6_9ASTE|nr:unnamed protein product [Cuscuta campestris]
MVMELSKFHDKSEGYLVEDTCLIEAEIDVSPTPTDKDSDSCVTMDPVKLGYIEAQSFLESLPKTPSSSAYMSPTCDRPLFKGHVTFAEGILGKLISYHLDDFADPNNEAAVMDFISVLANNISVFSDVQAKEIANLKATFPQIVQEWRDLVQVKGTGEHVRSTFVETKSVLQDLVKREEGIKTEVEELNNKETELKAELKVFERKSQMLKEEREHVSKQMVCCLVEEKASNIGAEDLEVDCANQKLEHGLKSKWAAMRHLFA